MYIHATNNNNNIRRHHKSVNSVVLGVETSNFNCFIVLGHRNIDCLVAGCLAPYCTYNGKNAVCKRCICAWSGHPFVSCLPLRNGNSTNNGIACQTNCTRKENCVNSVEEAGTNLNSSSENVSNTLAGADPEKNQGGWLAII